MNKYVVCKLIVLVCMAALLSGCDSYNYKRVFILNDEIWARARRIPDSDAFVIKLEKSEFEHIKPLLSVQGFKDWQPLTGVCSGKLKLLRHQRTDSPQAPIFSSNYRVKLDGAFAVMVYYPNENLLYLVIADMIGG